MTRNKVLVILGPTATGKTDVGIILAKKLNGEIVACDSRQVYKGLDIGTGKYPGNHIPVEKGDGYWVIDGIKIWLYDIVDLDTRYTVADYVKDASKKINQISTNGKLPIIVGGTGLYLKALLEGLSNLNTSEDKTLREELGQLSLPELQKRLQEISPERFGNMNNSDQQNKRRLLRAIELSMNPYIDMTEGYEGLDKSYQLFKIGLTAPRSEIFKKVDLRILNWLKDGIITEVGDLMEQGISLERFKELGLEYSLIADFINDEISTGEELIEKIRGKLHAYVRRQETWFKKEKDVIWFDTTDKNFLQKVENQASKWYH